MNRSLCCREGERSKVKSEGLQVLNFRVKSEK